MRRFPVFSSISAEPKPSAPIIELEPCSEEDMIGVGFGVVYSRLKKTAEL
eukprot:m.92735 g.92735  ORF g.92735 m.92735 type:complete len:50 (-) comp26565_c1_seq1:227-376(-)